MAAILPHQHSADPVAPAIGNPTVDEMHAIFFGDPMPVVCGQFARPGQVAPDRPAPDACMNCGQPERGHTPTATRSQQEARDGIRERLDRLRAIAPDQVEAGLAWLAGYHPVVFDAVLDAAETWDDGGDLADEDDLEPYCTEPGCGASVGIFLGHGKDWRHFRGEGTVASKIELYEADHTASVGWRRSGNGKF